MNVKFDNITLRYGNTTVLRNLSFDINPDTRLAIVGESGAGKSTIAKLLMRATDPTSGRILINDIPYPKYNLQSVLRHIGIILQKPEMVSGTVRENILLALHQDDTYGICDNTIWKMLDLISPMFRDRFNKDGLDTLVGKDGLQLSGGQQQRVCIARALIKRPEFLIVDEATASLDSRSERQVQEGIDTLLKQGISAVVIAHRLSTQRNCNKFLILKTLEACGPNESQVEAVCNSIQEAYEVSNTFRQLADLQGFRP